MSSTRRSLAIPLLLIAAPLLFSACGGSGGSTDPSAPATANVLQGIAATGGPLSGTISVNDCSFPNRSTSALINQDGTFSVSTAGLFPPYFIRAAGTTTSGAPMTIYLFASSPGTININPLTNLLVAAAAGASGSAGLTGLYANHNLSKAQTIAATLPGAISALRTALQPLSTLYGITALDPFSYPYQMNKQGLDGLFYDVSVAFPNGNATLTNSTGSAFYSAPLSNIGNGVLQSALLPVPTQYPMPGNARLTMVLGGLSSPGTLVKHLQTTIQLPLGVTVNTDSTGVSAVVNTAIPSGNGIGAIVYPSPALSSTNNQLSIEFTSLNGIGAGEFLTLRCIVSFAQLSIIDAADFSAISTQIYGDIYKQDIILHGGTVTLTNLVFPVVEGGSIYNGLCAGCHTLSTVNTVGMPSLLNEAALIPATFATVHHGISLTQLQIGDLQAFLEAQ